MTLRILSLIVCWLPTIAIAQNKKDANSEGRVYISSPEKPKAKPRVHRYKAPPTAADFAAPQLPISTPTADASTPGVTPVTAADDDNSYEPDEDEEDE